eukprot:CAMPEP_0117420464 /NCGR_PEP_ID=MMETSP0758-20121206/1790_1 /TAXON_ID=63605 /ORGANISM="Percolomonas cosmopolitus, Strain AE-1 (ATCC 50343)" /LENGTH=505 /DNA_ID=CAMNT_0005202083 /DNA_START=1014 /DNA_END=2528 /DNA_ORIENTATION=-
MDMMNEIAEAIPHQLCGLIIRDEAIFRAWSYSSLPPNMVLIGIVNELSDEKSCHPDTIQIHVPYLGPEGRMTMLEHFLSDVELKKQDVDLVSILTQNYSMQQLKLLAKQIVRVLEEEDVQELEFHHVLMATKELMVTTPHDPLQALIADLMTRERSLAPLDEKYFTGVCIVDLLADDCQIKMAIKGSQPRPSLEPTDNLNDSSDSMDVSDIPEFEDACLYEAPIEIVQHDELSFHSVLVPLIEFCVRQSIDHVVWINDERPLPSLAKLNALKRSYHSTTILVELSQALVSKKPLTHWRDLAQTYPHINHQESAYHYIFFVIKDESLKLHFQELIHFPRTYKEYQQERHLIEKKLMAKLPRTCINCNTEFTEGDHELCRFHPGILIQVLRSSGEVTRTDKRNALLQQYTFGPESDHIFYCCCYGDVNSKGCKVFKHSDSIDKASQFKEEWESNLELILANPQLFVAKSHKKPVSPKQSMSPRVSPKQHHGQGTSIAVKRTRHSPKS